MEDTTPLLTTAVATDEEPIRTRLLRSRRDQALISASLVLFVLAAIAAVTKGGGANGGSEGGVLFLIPRYHIYCPFRV